MLNKKFEIGLILIIVSITVSSYGIPGTIHPIKKLVFDTDAAADDGISLMMALEAERHGDGPKIIAITCLNGVTSLHNAVTNTLKILKVLNRTDIPVYAGASSPILEPNTNDLTYGNDGFGDFEFPDPPSLDLVQKEHAIHFLIDIVNRYPGEVTVLTMAPLTNLALAVRICPEFLNKVLQIIVMGGSTEGRGNVHPGIDYNSFVDPTANYIVFSSIKHKPIILVYLETTVRAHTSMDFRLSLNEFNNTRSWLLRNMERIALNPNAKNWYCPDAVAVVVATTSGSIVTRSASYYVEAIYDGVRTKGMTIVDYTNVTGRPANTILIQDIDVEAYKAQLLRTFS